MRYLTYWPVRQLLNYLSSLHPASDISLKDLTFKTLALVALTSSDRGQTIHQMRVDQFTRTDNGLDFVIFNRLKTTRKILKPKVVSCITSDIPSLNLLNYVTEYIQRTHPYREECAKEGDEFPNQLFLSWFTKRPVTRQTLTRWLRNCLEKSGIDSSQFTAHSFRGAGLSAAYAHGASIESIVKHGCWTNVNTFKRHYLAPENNSTVGKIILNQYKGGE